MDTEKIHYLPWVVVLGAVAGLLIIDHYPGSTAVGSPRVHSPEDLELIRKNSAKPSLFVPSISLDKVQLGDPFTMPYVKGYGQTYKGLSQGKKSLSHNWQAPTRRHTQKGAQSRKRHSIQFNPKTHRQGRTSASSVPFKPIGRRLIAPGATVKPAKAHAAWKKAQRALLFAWPVDPASFWISSQFGPRKKPNGRWALHAGVDMAAVRGTPVLAADGGKIIAATYSSGYGNYILIAHNNKFKTRYAHLDKILVRVGQTVKVGDYIGRVGATGVVRKTKWGSSGSHLHFEVYMKGKPVNPFYFLA